MEVNVGRLQTEPQDRLTWEETFDSPLPNPCPPPMVSSVPPPTKSWGDDFVDQIMYPQFK